MQSFLEQQRTAIIEAYAKLSTLNKANVSAKTGNSWSVKEIVGHLIDSASNNHQRFIRAQFTDELIFPGYDQNAWVKAGGYQQANWLEILNLWKYFNLVLIHAISSVPDDILNKERARHNLHLLAFNPVPQDSPATLVYFIRDYFEHLHHHLRAALRQGQ